MTGHPEGKARARSPRSVRQYMSRHRSEQRRMAVCPALNAFLFGTSGSAAAPARVLAEGRPIVAPDTT